jgi:hypothetical protein
MAFAFFTREGEVEAHDPGEARDRLLRLAERAPGVADREDVRAARSRPLSISPHERLKQLAGGDEDSSEEGVTSEPDE